MSESFDGKVVFLTGAAGGMGRGVAEKFAEAGASVVITDRIPEAEATIVSTLRRRGFNCSYFVLDACDKAQLQQVVKQVGEKFGKIDVVMHLAAAVPSGTVLDVTDADIDLGLTSILKSSFWLTQSAFPWLQKAEDGGRMIFVTSINGPNVVYPGRAAYAVAKTGLDAYIRCAALDLAGYGITVNGIVPGLIATDRSQVAAGGAENLEKYAKKFPIGRPGRPTEVAHIAMFLASKDAGYITGERIIIDGGVTLTTGDISSILIRHN